VQSQRLVDDLAGVLKLVYFLRRRDSIAEQRNHFVTHLRAKLWMPRQRPMDPAQARRRSFMAGKEQRGNLVAQRLVVELPAFRAARHDDALEYAAAFEIRGAVALDETEYARIERGDRRIEARDQRLRVRNECAHDIARRLRPVLLDGRSDLAEFIGDVRERLT